MFSLLTPTKISTLFHLLKNPLWVLGGACAGLAVTVYIQHQKLEIEGLKNSELKSELQSCMDANDSASETILKLTETQKEAEQKRQDALKKQREALEKLYAPREIKIDSEDRCANTRIPDDIRLRFETDN